MNKAILVGRLTRDPELKVTGSGINVCSFSVAVDRRFVKPGEQRQADFINCVAWRQSAEFIAKYFHKGDPICVEGSIQTRSYENKDGIKVNTTEVVVDNCSFTPSKPSGTSQAGGYASQNQAAPSATPIFDDLPNGGDFVPGDMEDDLPF